MDQEKIWPLVLTALKTEISEGTINTYFKQTELLNMTQADDRWVCEIGCNSAFIKSTLEQRYLGKISIELSRITGKKCEVIFKIKAHSGKATEEQSAGLPLFDKETVNKYEPTIKKANLKNDFTFDNYAVAGSNQMAFAAAQAVAKKPGLAYNPLFIYGGVGVGKTHLMQAIGHDLIKAGENNVLFCTGEEFTNDLVEAIRFKSTEKVRNKYRKTKLLMIDDVQFIAGKATVQEEFFHTFNFIQREGGQVVMTSDKPPAEISKLEERLKSRFGAGLIVDIGPANFELRTAILLIKAKQRGMEMAMEVAQKIATNIEGVRELQGFLGKLETEERLRGRKMTADEISEILNIPISNSSRARIITPAEIINSVGAFYGVGAVALKGERRLKTIAWPRQVLMYLLRNDLRLPLEEVGRLIGGRDHTTVLYAENKIKSELIDNHRFQAEISELRRKIFNVSQ